MAAGKKGGKRAENGSTVAQLVEAVESSSEFSAWRKANGSAYLTSLFVMVKDVARLAGDSSGANEWLLSFYDAEDDTFTTFSSHGSKMGTREQAFKKGKKLPELDAGAVKAEIRDSIAAAEKVRSAKYKGEEAGSIIAILQPLSGEEIYDGEARAGSGNREGKGKSTTPVWNITYITASYNVLNIKVDAGTCEVLSDRISGVMDFMQKDK